MITEVNKCRLCSCDEIDEVFNFGYSPLANAFKNKEDLDKKEFTAPLAYFKCRKCHSVQLKYEVSSEILFKEYLYESPPNLVPHFKELAKTTSEYLNLPKNSLVIDIGSNNGRLLKEYKDFGYRVLGIEPSNIGDKAVADGIRTVKAFWTKDFSRSVNYEDYLCPSLIVCTNTFAHLSDLNDFVDGLEITMTDNSYFVFENAYLYNMLINNDFGQLYFEHHYLHNVTSLQKLFESHGMELFKIEWVDVQLGSIRGYVRKMPNQKINKDNSVIGFLEKEKSDGLIRTNVYKDFTYRVSQLKTGLVNKLEEIKKSGKSICIYSWPAKTTLLCSYFGIEKYIDYAVEESHLKIGKFAPGTRLEVKNVEYFKNNPTDYCLVGAYNFFDAIASKNSWYEGQWINPLKI